MTVTSTHENILRELHSLRAAAPAEDISEIDDIMSAVSSLRARHHHRLWHPSCTYGAQPHFVPPSLGQVGFYLCAVPADLAREGMYETYGQCPVTGCVIDEVHGHEGYGPRFAAALPAQEEQQ